MWKCTGISSDAHASHTGSHARLARSGDPRSCGSEVRFTPRRPRSLGALHLAHARVDVPRGQDRHRQQPVARLRLELGVGVVEDLEAEVAQRDVLHEIAELLAAEADHAREDDLGPDADLVEQLHPRGGVVPGRVRLLDLPLVEAFERAALVAVLVDDAARAGPAEHDVALDDPRGRAVDLRDVRHAIAERGRRALRPEVVPLGHVGVGVDDLDLVQRKRHENPPRPVELSGSYVFGGKPRLTPPWLGSSQRLVTTLPRVKKCTPSGP